MKVYLPNFAKRGGLVTVVAQDRTTSRIIMVAHTDEAGYKETLETGKAVYFSTSRNGRWCKGEESGNTQEVSQILIDCDGDCLIYVVDQTGCACHTGAENCFFRSANAEEAFRFPVPKFSGKEELGTVELPVMEGFGK